MERLLLIAANALVLVVGFAPIERAFPARADQSPFRPAWRTDVIYFLGQQLLWSSLSLLVLQSVHGQLPSGGIFATLQSGVRDLPWALQALLAWVLGDLLVYWGHRACHSVPLLWRFHAVHHSAEHLDWIAAHREHPLDGIFTQLLMNLPALALGVSMEAMAPLVVFRGMWAVLIHSNVKLPLGPVGFIFGDPALHHWHHARVITRHNFANLAPWMDWIFGTYHRPEGEERYPLGLIDPFPKSYLGQLAAPFRGSAVSEPHPSTEMRPDSF